MQEKKQITEDALTYEEPYYAEDFYTENLNEGAMVYVEPYYAEDFYAESLEEDIDEGVETDNEEDETAGQPLKEDLISSFPVSLLSEAQVRDMAKRVVKGAKVAVKYVKELKLDSKYAQGKFVKKENKQYPTVKAIRCTECRGCTGVLYANTEGTRALHSTQEYQDRLADKVARTGKGFGTNVHDSEAGLENILVTTASGKKCLLVYPLSNGRARSTFYISIDGVDWVQATKEDIAIYMTPSEAEKLMNPSKGIEKQAQRQAAIYTSNGVPAIANDTIIVSSATGEKLKLMTHPLNITYQDPVSPFYGIYTFDKEVAIDPVAAAATPADEAEDAPLDQDFPSVDGSAE